MTADTTAYPSRRTGNSERLAIAGLIVITIATHAVMLGDCMHLSPDGVTYLRAARALARTGSLPPEHLTAPPGFVLALTPFVRTSDAPWLALRLFFLVASVCSVILTYKLARTVLTL